MVFGRMISTGAAGAGRGDKRAVSGDQGGAREAGARRAGERTFHSTLLLNAVVGQAARADSGEDGQSLPGYGALGRG